jgi:hypothetical protein
MSASSKTPHLADPDKNPSFTRGVFQGEIHEDLVFPFPLPSAEEKETLSQILDSFKSWAADTVDSAKMDHDGKFTPEVRQGMAELGLMGLNIPEEYGGFGASAMVFNRVFGEIGATDAALAVYFGAHQSIGMQGHHPLRHRGAEARVAPALRRGELVAAFCLTEPGSGSDAQAMKCTAVPTDDGEAYRSTGTKIWISNAGYAGAVHRLRQGPGRDRRPAQAARHRLHRGAQGAGHLARQARGEDGDQGLGHAHGDLRERARAGCRGPFGRGGTGLQDRPGDPQLRAPGPRRRLGARHAADHERGHSLT